MSNYTKSTNFTAKDSLPTGDTNKVVRGSEFDTEFNALATAVATKADLAGPTFTGTATFADITATGTIDLTGGSVTTNIDGGTIDGVTIGGSTPGAGTFSSLTTTTADINAGTVDNTVIGGATPAAGTFTAVAGTTGTFSGAVSGTTGTFSGAVTGSNLNVSNWDTAFGWGNHASAGYLTSVAFSDLDAGAVTLSSETFSDVDTQVPTNAAVIDYVAATIPLITEVNDLSSVVTWANVPDANITESSVTQHQAALSISTSQLAGGLSLSDITDVTATASEVNTLDGITATTAELNYTDGVTSNIQTQLDSKVGANYTGDVNITGELLVDSYNETFKKVTSSSNATTVNCENANVFEHVLTENTTFTFSNPPASGTPVVTGQYNFSTASYDSVSLSTGFGTLSELNFNNDGTKLYVVSESTDAIYQYSLSTAYDLSTASYDSVSFSLTSQDLTPNGLVFNGDGTKLYITGNTNDSVFQYSLSTAYDLSTISYDSVSLSVTSQDTSPQGVEFNNDGTKLYVVGASSDSVHQYSLNTAYDLSTASYDSVSFSFSSQDGGPRSIRWNNNGTKLYVAGDTNNTVFQYSLSTAYDISTLSYDSVSFSVASQSTDPWGLVLNGDGTKFYIAEAGNGTVYQYSLGTSTLNDSTAYAMSLKVVQDSGASGYTVTWPTSVDWPSATAPTLTATASAVDQFVFYTYDGGTNWYGFTAGQALG